MTEREVLKIIAVAALIIPAGYLVAYLINKWRER